MSDTPISLKDTIRSVRAKVEKASSGSGLAGHLVTLLAASKGQAENVIREAIAGGISDFGENRVQEAQEKWLTLRKEYPGVRLHLIGPLQTNKIKQALELFDVIQTIDRPKLAEAIAEHKPPGSKQFYIQVNTGEEPQKAGVMPKEADRFIESCHKDFGLRVVGLMCIPPHDQPPAPHFALLRQLAQTHGLNELSMGMSDDFETAVRMGATCVRLGRALFGERS